MSYGNDTFGSQPAQYTPPKKSNTLWIVLGILGVLGFLCCGGGALFFYFGARAISSATGALVEDSLKSSPEVAAEIGTVESITMNFQATGEEGRNNPGALVFDVKGSKGTAQAIAKTGGQANQITDITLRTSDGRLIPLQTPSIDLDVQGPDFE